MPDEDTSDEHGSQMPREVPAHCSAVRFAWRSMGGQSYQALVSLEDARGHPDAIVIMEADSGGQILLVCPVRLVKCEAAALEQLLADLELLTWGQGYDPNVLGPSSDAQLYFEVAPLRGGVEGGMGGGRSTGDLWLHPEIEIEYQLRSQVARVLANEQPRLELPRGRPGPFQLESLVHARAVRDGYIQLWSSRGGILIECPVVLVDAEPPRLLSLISDIELWLDRRNGVGPVTSHAPGRVHYVFTSRLPHRLQPVELVPVELEEIRSEIEAALGGADLAVNLMGGAVDR